MRIVLFLAVPLLLSPALAQGEGHAGPDGHDTPNTAPAMAAQSGTPAPASAPVPISYTENTPVEKIAADPDAAAVVKKDLPGLLEDSNYSIFKTMSLKQLQSASGGELSRNDVEKCVADLQALPGH
jgi:hypothetical protein